MSQRRSLRHGARIQNLSIEVFEVYGYIDTERLKGGAVVNIGWKLMLFQSAKLEILEFDGFDRRLDLIWDKMNLHRGPNLLLATSNEASSTHTGGSWHRPLARQTEEIHLQGNLRQPL